MALTIPQSIVASLISHAHQDDPHMCCGILAGTNGNVSEQYRITNVLANLSDAELDRFDLLSSSLKTLPPEERANLAFQMDTQESGKAQKDIKAKGLVLQAYYNSHPHSPARPSAISIKIATEMESFYQKLNILQKFNLPVPLIVIISLLNKELPDIRGYRVTQGKAFEVPLVMEGKQEKLEEPEILQNSKAEASASQKTEATKEQKKFTSLNHAASSLKTIIVTEGIDPINDPQRFRGMLADLAHHQPAREREVLLRAIKSPIFERAWHTRTNGGSATVQLNGLAHWLAYEYGYGDELCRWAVGCWSLALGYKTGSH